MTAMLLAVLGALLIVGGVAMLSLPAAFCTTGLILLVASYMVAATGGER